MTENKVPSGLRPETIAALREKFTIPGQSEVTFDEHNLIITWIDHEPRKVFTIPLPTGDEVRRRIGQKGS